MILVFLFFFLLVLCKKRHFDQQRGKDDDECAPGCKKSQVNDGLCHWRCYNKDCDFDGNDCDPGCKSARQGMEWLEKSAFLQEIWRRVYIKNETVTFIGGEYVRNYDFKKQDYSKDLDTYDPDKPGTYNPWDPLKEVILGRLEGAGVPYLDPHILKHYGSDGEFPPTFFIEGKNPDYLWTKGQSELKYFKKVLGEFGAKIFRPTKFNFQNHFKINGIDHEGYNNAMARDLFLIVGNHFFTSRFSYKSRAKEVQTYDKLMKYITEKGGIVHRFKEPRRTNIDYNLNCVPERWRKLLRKEEYPDKDCKFKDNDLSHIFGGKFKNIFCPVVSNHEALYDAPDCQPIGNDVFCQLSIATNVKAIRLISRELGDKFRVHILPVHEVDAMHIDIRFIPLRDKLIMVQEPVIMRDQLPSYFDDWIKLAIPPPEEQKFKTERFFSPHLNGNVLTLDTKNIVVEQGYTKTIGLLESHGFNVLKVPLFFSTNPINGGPHCATADLWRDGSKYKKR